MLQKLRARIVRQGPSLLSVPLKFTPFAVSRQVLQQVLSWQLRQALADGELDFLESRWLNIEVSDLNLSWQVSVGEGKLIIREQGEADVSFSGHANDLILIAARNEDPDTLFFQRRLRILKNGLLRLVDFVEAGLQEGREPQAPVAEPC